MPDAAGTSTSVPRADTPPPVAARGRPARQGLLPDRPRLVALSFLMLFAELALIRWLGANVFYLSYFSNFVLLGSFLGLGLGFLWAGRSARTIYPVAPLLLGVLVAYVYVFDVPLNVTMRDVVFFDAIQPSSALPREVVLTLLFVSVAAAMACIGDGVARTFGRFPPLVAYKWDLVGSVLGIGTFTLLAFLGARPLVWGVLMAAIFIATLPAWPTGRVALLAVGLGLLLAPLVHEAVDTGVSDEEASFAGGTATNKHYVWSPYYRITSLDTAGGGKGTFVNQTPHWRQVHTEGNPLYESVYERMGQPQGGEVLIIGAGSGNDAAAALRHDADHVDAVEIDPRLMEIARDSHPEHPYDDPRVDIHIDDGRAFLERSNDRWDKILLALPDSLTLVQGQSSIRLESYLFTQEAVRTARERLAPGGVFAMYNWYRQPWLIDRYAATLASVFDAPPCVHRLGNNFAVLLASDDAAALDCPDETWVAPTDAPEPVSDDHPFPYLQTRSVPSLYVWSGLLVLGLSVASVAAITLVGRADKAAAMREVGGYADLFFMGVAFLLLETKSVVQFALLFGTTWLVNALVFLGVLGSVLVAVAVSRRMTFRRPARLYVVLLAALALAYVIPPERLLELDVVPRFLAAVTLAFFPIFTANLVFTQRFKDTAHSTVAFGANLIGAMVGGLLEYAALVTGYRNLLVIVALAYGLAFLAGRRHLTAPSEAEAPEVAPPVGEPLPV